MDHRLRRAAACLIETLEVRRLLASISGTVVEDLNFDGRRDGREPPMAGIPVYLDQNRNRRFDAGEPSVTTDANGFYEFSGLSAGDYLVSIIPPAEYAVVAPGPSGQLRDEFDIELRYFSSVSAEVRSLFESAARRWEQIIVGDLPDVKNVPFQDDIDDIRIDVRVAPVDGEGGTLAEAAPTDFRAGSALPSRGQIRVDQADLNLPSLYETILHEIGHVLGFGTLWTILGLIDRAGSTNPVFTGRNAVREYNRIFGTTGKSVPVEGRLAGPTSADGHWRESVFGTEMMSSLQDLESGGSPISRVTVAQFADLGYEVNYDAADFYDPEGGFTPFLTPESTAAVPFHHRVRLPGATGSAPGRDFLARLNRRPTLDALRSDNSFYQTGDIVKLRAFGAFDRDPGDFVTAVHFYAETNGLPGFQSGPGGDRLLGTDDSSQGGFRLNANTAGLGLSAGTATFYARPMDRLEILGKPRQLDVRLFDPDSPPAKPSVVTAVAQGSGQILVRWNDRSDNEAAFRIERARDSFFTRDVRRINAAADATRFLDTGLEPGTEYFYRVRAFNVGGASPFAGPASALTPTAGEVRVDDQDTTQVTYSSGTVLSRASARSRGGGFTLVEGATATALIAPNLPRTGDYYVFASWQSGVVDGAVPVNFAVTDNRRRLYNIPLDQNQRGRENGEVLLGKFRFNRGGATVVVLTPAVGGDAFTFDQMRFVPIG
ncbi:MAG: SdrD B-like domain-containing protein [Phycisphaerales bacterium]|nr:SdrD B-like domain-containing protein [Phycisphaerales bacterium]